MNKKELSEYLHTLAIELQRINPSLTISEAQSLIGMATKRISSTIIKLATPASLTTTIPPEA